MCCFSRKLNRHHNRYRLDLSLPILYIINSMLATEEREAIQEIVMKLVEEALNQRASRSGAAANESKRLELLERIVKLEEGQKNILARLEAMQKGTNQRFEAMQKGTNQRFDDLIHYLDKRFDDIIHYVDKRFEQVERRFRFQQWLIGGGFALLALLMTLYAFLA